MADDDKTPDELPDPSELAGELTEALDAVQTMLADTHKGVSVREFVERWDAAWAGRFDLEGAIESARGMIALIQSGELPPETLVESLPTFAQLFDQTKDWMRTMAEDTAPTPEQRIIAYLDRIEERQLGMEGQLKELREEIERGLF